MILTIVVVLLEDVRSSSFSGLTSSRSSRPRPMNLRDVLHLLTFSRFTLVIRVDSSKRCRAHVHSVIQVELV